MFKDFAGLKIITDVNLIVQLGTREVERIWKERLFSLPWRPWQATKQVANMVPDPNIYRLKGNVVCMHPVMVNSKQIQNAIRDGFMQR